MEQIKPLREQNLNQEKEITELKTHVEELQEANVAADVTSAKQSSVKRVTPMGNDFED